MERPVGECPFGKCNYTLALESRLKVARDAIQMASDRFDTADEQNKHAGFPRGSVAWAMSRDLRKALKGLKEVENGTKQSSKIKKTGSGKGS